MKAFCLNNISQVALATLRAPDCVVQDVKEADSILVRSQEMHDMKLEANILAVARAGAGVNNIPLEDYAREGVVVFNTPGANGNAVKELVLAGMLLASRDIIGGNAWIKANAQDANIAKSAEKAKKAFAGHELLGKTITVMGLGAIGILVSNACVDLGMKVVGYDPYLSVKNALKINRNVKIVDTLVDAAKGADFVTIHVPAMDSTKGMLNKDVFNVMNSGAVVLNFARDTLVNEADLQVALATGKIGKYVTDFVNPAVLAMDNVIAFPHLGASTEEAEDNCALMAIEELKDYLQNGNITHSVNYPDAWAGEKAGAQRICICHKNIPGMLAVFSSVASKSGANIETLVNKGRGDFAYTIIDVNKAVDLQEMQALEGVIRVRAI